MKRRLILSISFLLILWSGLAFAEDRRRVTIPWKSVAKATEYEIELARNPEMIPLAFKKRLAKNQLTLMLAPGTYYFRVRGYRSAGSVGPWTSVQGFSVSSTLPKVTRPSGAEVISKKLGPEGVILEWEKSDTQSEYLLEVRDQEGVALKRSVNKNTFSWMPPKPGTYTVRIGFSLPSGEEWGAPSVFSIDRAALPDRVRIVEKVVYRGASDQQSEAQGAHAGVSAIIRAAQAIGAYSVKDLDNSINASAGPLVGAFSAEVRWRLNRFRQSKWQLSGSLNLEMLRPNYYGETFNLLRGYTRVFATYANKRWRYGPVLHFNYGQGGIFVQDPSTNEVIIRTRVQRMGIGAGAVVVYQAGESMYFSGLVLGRYDMGGSDATIPSALNSDLGFEAGFGVVIGLTQRLFFEGRLRAQQESYSWAATNGTGNSSFSQTFIILDIGLGYHF